MAISYRSRFFLFWRRQWQHWQHQWQRQRWQLESTLSGALQLIGGILSQFVHQRLPQLRDTLPRLLPRLKAASPPTADRVIQAVTAAIELHPEASHPLTLHLTPLPRRLSWWQWLYRLARPPIPKTALGQRTPFYLACDCQERSLILLNTAGVTLKTFSRQEQQLIEQRIDYELASYYQQVRQWYRRHHRQLRQRSTSRCLTTAFLNQLTVTSTATELIVQLPALSPLARLWQWWQSRLLLLRQPSLTRVRVQGIASQLKTRQMVLIGTDNSILYTLTPQEQQQVLAWIEQHLRPAALGLSIQEWLSRAAYWLGGLPPPLLSSAVSSPLAATEPMPALPSRGRMDSATAPATAAPTIDANHAILEAEAAFMGYELHWLEQLLLWCDRLLWWLEGRLIALGRWLVRCLRLPGIFFGN